MKKFTLFLVAIFAMVNVANAQRAWAYDLELTPLVDSYKFAFKAVTAGDAALVFYKEGVEAGTLDLGSVSVGDNTVTKTSEELLGAIQQSGDFTWGVKMSAGAIAAGSTLKQLNSTLYYNMMGIVADVNPESDYFGKVYLQMSYDGKPTYGTTKQTQGFFIYDPIFNLISTPNVGIKPTLPTGYTFDGTNRLQFHRVAIDPKTGNLAFCYSIANKPGVFSIGRNNLTGEVTNLLAGVTGIENIKRTNALCFDEDGALYIIADVTTLSTTGNIYKIVDGVATKLTLQGKQIWIDEQVGLVSDGRGGLWVAQNRSGITGNSAVFHVNVAKDTVDFVLEKGKTYSDWFTGGNGNNCRGGIAYNVKENVLATHSEDSKVSLFKVTYDEETGVPTITKWIQGATGGKNTDAIAFDYAGDLYTGNSSGEYFRKFEVPTDNNTCTTPAKKSQVITLVSATPEYNVTINVNGNGTVTGANTGKYLEGTELTLTATPAEHYEFTGWTGDVTSDENPLTIPVNSDLTVTANFAKKNYTLTVFTNDEDKGTIDVATGSHEAGTELTLTATPKEGYKLLYWSDRSKENPRTITMNKNEAISAYFVKEYSEEPTFTIEKVWENAQVPAATGDGYQAVGWDQKIYMQNKTAGKIQVFSNGTDATVDYATSGTGQQIAVDEAGNLIVFNAYFATSTPNSVLIYKKGDATGTAVSFTLQDPARCDFFSASGDIYSPEGGYVYFYCAGKTVINRLKITNGAATTSDVITDVVGESVYSSPQNTNYVMVDIFGNLVAHARSNAINAINIYTNETKTFSLQNIKMGTLGGCSFELGGKELWAYHAGATNYSSEWNLYNMTDGKFLSDTILYAVDKTNSTNNACNWLNVQVVDEKTAYIYQFCPKKAVALWKVSLKENYSVSASATNGTVTGTGTYQEGATATLTATPNTGYKFVNWTKDGVEVSTEATYSLLVTENVALVANFEAITSKDPRAWAYDMKLGEEGDNYTFTFKATTAGQATITFNDKDGNALAQPASQTMEAVVGENKFTIAKNDFAAGMDAFWSITMDGAPIEGVVEVTDQSRGIYDFYNMMGVVVDNNTDSKDFGKIYVQQSYQRSYATSEAKNDGITTRANNQTSGIFIYNQELDELNSPSNVGIKPTMPSGYTEIGSSSSAFQRLNIDPKTGNLVFSHAIEGKPAVFAINRDDMTGAVTNLLTGVADMTRSVAHCFDAEGTLYVMDFAGSTGAVYKVINGDATRITEISAKFINAQITMASDGRGGLWISQNRGQMDGAPYYYQLVHVTSTGEFDWCVNKETPHGFEGSSSRGALAYDVERNILAQGRNGKVELYTVSYEPTITLTPLHTIASNDLGNNIDGLAFDYAGDLYVVNSSKEKFQKFALPTDENICTVAAPALEAIRSTPVYTVSVESNNNEWGIANGGGTFEENQNATITAVAATNYEFVNWTKEDVEVSTENPYTFAVTESATYIANFKEITKYTINVTYDNIMGTVTGDGSYYEGTEVTLTATAKGGYVFVNWSDGNTDETRTFTAGVDMPETLTANFKVAVPRAWAYDLRLDSVADPANYIFTFKTTSAGTATLIFKDKDGNTLDFGAYTETATAAEEKTIQIAKTVFVAATKDIYWEVELAGDAIAKMAEITEPTKGIYDIVAPQGIAVDNNTDSKHFGQVYVAAATDGTVSRGAQTRGIFVYDPILNELNSPNAGYLPANATLTSNTRQAIHRVAVSPTNNQVAFAYNISGSSAIWSMNPENLAGDAVNMIEGAGITKANSLCFDEAGALYVMDNANTGTGGKIYKIQNGVGDVFADAQAGNLWAVEDNAMTSDGRGGLWIAQNRWSVDGYPVLSHVNSNGQVDFAVSQNSSAELQALFPYDDNNASYRGQCAYYVAEDILAFAGNKEAVLFKITYDANDVPTNLEKLMSTGKLGVNIDGIAFDYAGDLYVASETTHRFYKFVVPTNDNTCTVPAPKSQVIQKEARYTVNVVANSEEMGTVSGGGTDFLYGDAVTVKAVANTNYEFVNWTENGTEVSTDAEYIFDVEGDRELIANFRVEPLKIKGIVKRAVQVGESTVVLTHEGDGTPHLYKVVNGELTSEISQVGVEPAAAGYLSISDIAATEDGKLVACNYVKCTFPTASGTSNFYIWHNLELDSEIWFTAQTTGNYSTANMGYSMAVKGTSTAAQITISGFNVNKGSADVRFAHHTIVGEKYQYSLGIDNTTNQATVGNNYELNASPLANANWIIDGENITPVEFTNNGTDRAPITINATISEDLLGKKFNGATYFSIAGAHFMVAPYADAEGKVAGVKLMHITDGFAAAKVLKVLDLPNPETATAAATAVLVDEVDNANGQIFNNVTITLITDAKVHTLTTELDIYVRDIVSGNYGTICLPYNAIDYTGASLFEVAGKENGKLYFDEISTMEEGTPYLLLAEQSKLIVVYGTTSVASPDNTGVMKGTFEDIVDDGTILKGNYMVYNNTLRLCGDGCWLSAYRAYFGKSELDALGKPMAPMPGRRRVEMGGASNNEATGLENITEGAGVIIPIAEGTYDVLGRELSEPNATGFYIINGKKVVIVK